MNYNKKNITVIITCLLAFFVFCFVAFDVNNKVDVLLHPERYSFRTNFASTVLQNDYYLSTNIIDSDAYFKELKKVEKEYKNKTDEKSLKIQKLNNYAFDCYHDLLTLKMQNKKISPEDYIFLAKNKPVLADFYYMLMMTSPKLEKKLVLFKEQEMRKEAIKIIKKELKKLGIDAKISLRDIGYESLIPLYMPDDEAAYMVEFIKEFKTKRVEILDEITGNYKNIFNSGKNDDSNLLSKIKFANEFNFKYQQMLDELDIKWKHRYLVTAIEYKNNNEDKIKHLFEIYPYNEGNRIYWNIKYHEPTSKFLKVYTKILESIMAI